jgi:sporulation protein YlmC with PRC-barrel domain
MLVSELAEKGVYDSSMALVGRIKDIDIDPVSFVAKNLIVELERGVARKALGGRPILRKVKAKVSVSYIHRLGDAVVLNLPMEDLKGKLERF